jgi:hypothetical protein
MSMETFILIVASRGLPGRTEKGLQESLEVMSVVGTIYWLIYLRDVSRKLMKIASVLSVKQDLLPTLKMQYVEDLCS